MPNSPAVTIEQLSVPRSGVKAHDLPPINRRIWSTGAVPGAPVVIQGSDLDEVYDRVCEAAAHDAANGTLIVHLDLPTGANGDLPLPSNYPLPEPMDEAERRRWLRELVERWQLDRSGLEHRMPFVHGSRLRRYGGKINQVDRIIKLLKAQASTRALAVLIDPFRDFTHDGAGEEFASFCLVEFNGVPSAAHSTRLMSLRSIVRRNLRVGGRSTSPKFATFSGKFVPQSAFRQVGSPQLPLTLVRTGAHQRKLQCPSSIVGSGNALWPIFRPPRPSSMPIACR